MTKNRNCMAKCPGKNENSNCKIFGTDNLPLQCVGDWTKDKHYFLNKYLIATREARKKFSDKGNAVFIDLFAGPGKCFVRQSKEEVLSGGMQIFSLEEGKFNECYFFDLKQENINALEKRFGKQSGINIKKGDSNELVKTLVPYLKTKDFRYHVAYLDPFAPSALKFETIKQLAELPRMDLLLHFPISAIKRNIKNWRNNEDSKILDEFLGTKKWKDKLSDQPKQTNYLLNIYFKQLKDIGYKDIRLKNEKNYELKTVSIKNKQNAPLYMLILASKHDLGKKIWNSIIKTDRKGQAELF